MNERMQKGVSAVLALALTAFGLYALSGLPLPVNFGAAQAAEIPAPVLPKIASPAVIGKRTETVIFSGGCFWGVQGVFQRVKGVKSAVSGYAGGAAATANYEMVSSGRTGHAESVRVVYDPAQISYGSLMQIFFSVVHDPTQLNYQGPDRGTQYRSAIFTTTPEQLKASQAYIAQLDRAKVYRAPIVTRIEKAVPFYAAEAYHQDYLTLHPDQAYIRYHDLPKVANLARMFPKLYREQPVLVGR